jgi:hypothetical protein
MRELHVTLKQENEAKSWADRIQPWAQIASLILIAPLIAVGGWLYQRAASKTEVAPKYVEVAISILRDPSQKDPGLRQWAVETIKEYSRIPLSAQTAQGLADGAILLPLLSSEGTVETSNIVVAASPRPRTISITAKAECAAAVGGSMELTVLGPSKPCTSGKLYRNPGASERLATVLECSDDIPAGETRTYRAVAPNALASGRVVRLEIQQTPR